MVRRPTGGASSPSMLVGRLSPLSVLTETPRIANTLILFLLNVFDPAVSQRAVDIFRGPMRSSVVYERASQAGIMSSRFARYLVLALVALSLKNPTFTFGQIERSLFCQRTLQLIIQSQWHVTKVKIDKKHRLQKAALRRIDSFYALNTTPARPMPLPILQSFECSKTPRQQAPARPNANHI
jgi:hypothetical protein